MCFTNNTYKKKHEYKNQVFDEMQYSNKKFLTLLKFEFKFKISWDLIQQNLSAFKLI